MATTVDNAASYFRWNINDSGAKVNVALTTGAGAAPVQVTRWHAGSDLLQVVYKYTTTDIASGSGQTVYPFLQGVPNNGIGNIIYGPVRTSNGTSTVTFNIPANRLDPATTYNITIGVMLFYSGQNPTNANGLVLSDATRKAAFITNRKPNTPVITSPTNNITLNYGSPPDTPGVDLNWTATDPDDKSGSADYNGWEMQHRVQTGEGLTWTAWETPDHAWDAGIFYSECPAWHIRGSTGAVDNRAYWDLASTRLVPRASGSFGPPVPETYYHITPGTHQFRVRTFDSSNYDKTPGTADPNGTSEWSEPVTVHVVAPYLPPTPLTPSNNEAVWGSTIDFDWQYNDPRPTGGTQSQRRLRVRQAGQSDTAWVEIIPTAQRTSSVTSYTYTNGTSYTFEPGIQYEWQAHTRSNPGNYDSGWSFSQFFWFTATPGSGSTLPAPTATTPDPGLGCGNNRVFVYRRGGLIPVGEIAKPSLVDWSRVRDDISMATVNIDLTNADSAECAPMLSEVRSWLHELVIFRDSGQGAHRVWEGPITRITYTSTGVSIEARDVMIWPYRRILRQGYSDAYRTSPRRYVDGELVSGGQVISQPERVTIRSSRTLQNALAYDDPNVLPYLTVYARPDDAKQSRTVYDFSRSSWQDVDDLAAKAGLDYTAVGRRIILWDTHNPLGQLPLMTDGDFDTDPIVTEYGMQAANVYGVTNNSGVYGLAEDDRWRDEYGYIEMLSSAYGESDAEGTEVTLTAEARARLEETLTEQAERNIEGRWPPPLLVRVPDNSTLSPDVQVTINQLIPGVYIPLMSDSTLRKVSQMQKLDRVRVTQDPGGETVKVTMSPSSSRDADEVEEEDE